MKRFQFSLERALAWRRTQLKLEEAAAAKLLAEVSELETRRMQLQEQRDTARGSSAGAFSATDMYTLAAYQHRCLRLEAAISQQLGALHARQAAQQHRVLEADRAVRLLEKLREGSYRTWEHNAAAEQEQFAAEAFLCRWTKRPAAEPPALESRETIPGRARSSGG